MGAAGESDGGGRAPSIARLLTSAAAVSERDARAQAAWRSWLTALATDAEAAIAAAMAYGALAEEARDAWLDALDADAATVDVPRVALYAPLLAVEADPARRARIDAAIGAAPPPSRALEAHAGDLPNGDRVCVVASPLYLDFVELLVCRVQPDGGVVAAHHDPLRHAGEVARAAADALEERVELRSSPVGAVIEELAHAIVADRREGRDAPDALARFVHLFVPDLEAS